jgi:hypothetical protein
MRGVVESLNKSSYLRSLFEERQTERTKKEPVKISNAPAHRWGATEGTMTSWEDLAYAFRRGGRGTQWEAMEEIKTVVEEFHSVIKPFREVQTLSQCGNTFKLLDAILSLTNSYNKIARGVGNVVTMLWPLPTVNNLNNNGRTARPIVFKDGDRLDPRTRVVIQKLRFALTKRYFYRYHPVRALKKPKQILKLTEANVELTDFDSRYLFDLAQLFHPHLYKGCFIDKNCELVEVSDSDLACVARVPALPSLEELRTRHAHLVKAALWKKIRELAVIACRDMDTRQRAVAVSQSLSQSPVPAFLPSQDTLLPTQTTTPETPPSRKRQRSMTSTMGLGSPDSIDSTHDSATRFTPSSAAATISETVDDEILRYKTLNRSWPHDKHTCRLGDLNAIEWWCRWGEGEFPCLAKVALAVFGLLPGSGALECDIGGFKDVILPKRSRMDPAAVEMHLVINKNKDLTELDPGRLVALPATEWERMYPSRPESPVDYHEEEGLERVADSYVDMELSYDFDPNDPFH